MTGDIAGDKTGDIDRYAVMGNPIAHSKSPMIHSLFARQTEQSLCYDAILVPVEGFTEALDSFRLSGGKGLNITVPFKQQAWQLVAERSERAQLAEAVNTIVVREDRSLFGDNTDGVGLVRDLLLNHGVSLTGKRVLLIGAGGAVRGVLGPILEERPASVVIANRTASKAGGLAKHFSPLGAVRGCGLQDEALQTAFDIIINGTAASLKGEVPDISPNILHAQSLVYDMMYSVQPTAFMQWARQQGCEHTLDGLGMLVEQAAESFFLWRGIRPHTEPVIQAVRSALSNAA